MCRSKCRSTSAPNCGVIAPELCSSSSADVSVVPILRRGVSHPSSQPASIHWRVREGMYEEPRYSS